MITTTEQQTHGVRVHELKCWPDFFEKVKAGRKTFDVRRNDCNYMVGDYILFQEWELKNQEWENGYSGRTCKVEVTYVMRGRQNNPIALGYVVMSFTLCS